MSKKLATLTFGLLMLGVAFAEEPVCRVQSIVKSDNAPAAKLLQKKPGDKEGYPVTQNCTGYVKDRYITDANTVATLEFLIGGRVGINKNTEVEVVNERSVADGKTPVKRFVLKNGAMLIKADAKTLKQPIEIQTNGGVMGIKGTEFTVENNPDGTSRVCCFESNSEQGGVELRDTNGKVVSTVKPGDEYLTTLKGAEVQGKTTHYDDVQQFRQDRTQQIFGNFQQAVNYFFSAVSLANAFGAGINLGGAGTTLGYVSSAASVGYNAYELSQMDMERDPVGSAYRINSAISSAGVNTGPAGTVIGWGNALGIGGSSKPAPPDFPYELTPDATPNSKQSPQAGEHPQFGWHGVDGAKGYVVLLGKDQEMNEIVFSERTNGNSLAYPSNMRPLEKGSKYFWRVIPVDEEDKPTQKASEAFFTVS